MLDKKLASATLWLAALLTGACGPMPATLDASLGDGRVDLTCLPLSVDPSSARVATDGALTLHAVGGGGTVVFTLDAPDGGPAHSTVEPGGGVHAGSVPERFTVLARDARCGLTAQATVEVVGPFAVLPLRAQVPAGGTVRYAATGNLGVVHYSVLDGPGGAATATVDDNGVFHAGPGPGTYDLVARDDGSGNSVRMSVDVGTAVPLRARTPILAVPQGMRIALAWYGGSGSLDAAVTGAAGGSVQASDDNTLYFDATSAVPGYSDVNVTDRYTHETARVRVLVGQGWQSDALARGSQLQAGELAVGDVNGDGRSDLLVGHAERSRAALEAGGVLIYYGQADGTVSAQPDVVLEGTSTRDHFGSTLLVRDLNGDHVDDLVVGSPDEDLGEADRGGVRVFLGSSTGMSTTPVRSLVGEDAGHRFGSAVAVAELNGDNAPELVVTASSAVNALNRTCLGGRAYVYRGHLGSLGPFESIPWQILDLRDTFSDAPTAPVQCGTSGLTAGRSVALFDLDGDHVLDLAVGAPGVSFPTQGRSQGSVQFYRGSAEGLFATTPTWIVRLDPSVRTDNAAFGTYLDVVGPASQPVLVVRVPGLTGHNAMGVAQGNAGGWFAFTAGMVPAPPGPAAVDGGMVNQAANLTTSIARGSYAATTGGHYAGRSGFFADVDGDGASEYLVSTSASGYAGSVLSFSLASLTGGAATASSELLLMGNADLGGYRVAALPGSSGQGAGLVSWAAWRTTAQGSFVGAVDYLAAGPGALATRWMMHRTLELPGFGAGTHTGAWVALADFAPAGSMDAVVSSPAAQSPMTMTAAAAATLRPGVLEVLAPGQTMSTARVVGTRSDQQLGGQTTVTLDFDGDGQPEIAVADPNDSSGGAPPMGIVQPGAAVPADCGAINAMGMPAAVGGRGSVHVYALTASGPVERFRLVPARETPRMAPANVTFWGNHFGTSLAVADVNGDGKQDLIVGHGGTADGNGVEVVLGRRNDDAMGRTQWICNTGDGPVVASQGPTDGPLYGAMVAGLGDLDGDGCDELASTITRHPNSTITSARAGVMVAFGYGATAAQCHGHTQPFWLHVTADDRYLDDNVAGSADSRNNDAYDLLGQPTTMGRTLALGSGDVTGDGAPDLVFRDVDLAYATWRGPSVEVLSGAMLAGLCPNHVCVAGRRGGFYSDGDYHVLTVRMMSAPDRLIVPSPLGTSQRFGATMALGDLDGDRAAELVVGVPDDSTQGDFVGAVYVWRGGTMSATQTLLLSDPWLFAAGDIRERSDFGVALAAASSPTAGGWLVVGAPLSNRSATGSELGQAWRWRVEVPR